MKTKKRYEKPELKSISMLEVGAATCCRATSGVCTNAKKNAIFKKSRTLITS